MNDMVTWAHVEYGRLLRVTVATSWLGQGKLEKIKIVVLTAAVPIIVTTCV